MKQGRAVLLPTPGDPFLIKYWIDLFNNIWSSEVQTLYVFVNSPIEPEVMNYIKDILHQDNIYLITINRQIEHGDAIDALLNCVAGHNKEDYLMLVEDDGFIFNKDIINLAFSFIESGQFDIVGSKRGSCHQELLDRAKEIWNLDYTGEGDQGPNFWPCFFFCKRQTLLKTDRNFKAKAWHRGEEITFLNNYIVKEEIICSDTFVNTSLQLRALIPENRINYLPQFHGHPDDIEHYYSQRYLFYKNSSGYIAPWCHIGSLSSGVCGVLMDDKGRSLARRQLDKPQKETILPKYCNTELEKFEWERRVQWWLTFYEHSDPNKLHNFRDAYKEAIFRIIEQYKLSLSNIRTRQRIYKELGLP
jgi:hypothetical protein